MIDRFLRNEIQVVIAELYPEIVPPHFDVSDSQHSDYASNVPMVLASLLEKNPREVATEMQDALLSRESVTKSVESIQVAGPGFLNFTLGDPLLQTALQKLSARIEENLPFLTGEKINIEFISANPTGKLHIGHGRGAFYGDVLANIFAYSDAFVTREFYVNNSRESKQINELGKTALREGEQYKTPALEEKMKHLDFSGLSQSEAGALLSESVQEDNQSFIEEKLKITFDMYYSEDLHLREEKRVEEMRQKLEEQDLVYEKDGALWLQTSEYGDDEDRVIVRSDGTASYFLGDIAYHADKFSRGLDRVFNIWGADHGGHVKRMQAVKKMLNWQGDFHIFIAQLVMLRGETGERTKMSKRAGNVVLLEDLVEEVGIDVVRWFFLEKSLSTHMDFDLDLARDSSEKNPVRYVQYAHVRMCSIREKAGDISIPEELSEVIKEPSARALALKLSFFPEVVDDIAKDYAVNKLTTYATELAQSFSAFYHGVRVIAEDGEVNAEALALVEMTQKTLEKVLNLLGISAPERM